jgi:hypothetical protein
MFGQQYYYALTRKYVIAFGNLFNDTYIARTDDQGNITQYVKVPLTYAGKDKMLAVVKANPEELKSSQINLPIMSFELMGLVPNWSRKLDTLNRYVRKATDLDKANYIYDSVCYDLQFNLYIWVKNREDGIKIIDQILPNFKPNWDMTLNLIPEMNIVIDTPVIIGTPTYEDKYDGSLTTQNPITWTIPFTMKAQYFGVTKTKPIIKISKQVFHFGNPGDTSDPVGELTITPGLTANGDPTSVANQSINVHSIAINDDFGFVVEESALDGIVFTGNT